MEFRRVLFRSRLKLATVCEEAACPNIGECWTKKHATVMILGDVCTRACAFCNVKTGMPRAVDSQEPQHVADAAAELGLEHIVITSVDRDDLLVGGASQFVKVIEALRRTTPDRSEERRVGKDGATMCYSRWCTKYSKTKYLTLKDLLT